MVVLDYRLTVIQAKNGNRQYGFYLRLGKEYNKG